MRGLLYVLLVSATMWLGIVLLVLYVAAHAAAMVP